MVFAVVEDLERAIWIVESTPVGTHCWTLEQAAELPQGLRTRRALKEAIALGRQLQRERAVAPAAAEDLRMPQMLPAFSGEETELDATPWPCAPYREAKDPVGV